MALDKNIETFVIHVTSLSLNLMPIHLALKAQIILLVIQKVQIPSEYSDFSDIFSEKKDLILPEAINLNQHIIELQKSQQLSYRPIYSLDLVKLKILKTYIKTNFFNNFIWPSKSPAGALIFFIGKLDGNLYLCVNDWGLNNFTIKNKYLLSLISKLLN